MTRTLALLAPLAVSAWLAPASPAQDRDLPPPAGPTVVDDASMFDPEAVKQARAALEKVEHASRIHVLVQTEEKIDGDSPAEAASRFLKEKRLDGLLVLIGMHDRKLEVMAGRAARGTFTREQTERVRDAILTQFRNREFDKGLLAGVRVIEEVAAGARPAAPRASDVREGGADTESGTPKRRELVARQQVRLNLAGARALIAGAAVKAGELGVKANIAVVDDGGHLLAFERLDGARPASVYTALTKATTAATYRQETGPMPKGAAQPDVHLSLSLQNAAAASGGKLTTLFGGVPVVVEGQVIGAVGVGGGSGEQDAEIARAGVKHFQGELEPASPRTDDSKPARP